MTREIELSAGTLDYTDTGGEGPVLLLLHGLMMDASLWDEVIADLPSGYRCLAPVLPLGAHRRAMKPGADLSLPGIARLVSEFAERLDLNDVTVVANDTGGAIAQLLITDPSPRVARVARVVLVSCDAFENFPPGLTGKTLVAAGRLPAALFGLFMQQLRLRPVRRLPIAFGWLTKRGDAATARWIRPVLTDSAIRRDTARVLRAIAADKRLLIRTAESLPDFNRPALVVWARGDRVMPPEHGIHLAELLPDAKLTEVDDSYTLVPLDQPRQLAELIDAFVGARKLHRAAGAATGALAGLVEGGGPGGEELEGVVGRGAGLGGVGGDPQAGVGGEVEGLEGEREVADDRMVQPLDASAVEADVVGGPPEAEVLVAGGQLADEVRQRLVVRVVPGLGAQHGDDVLGLAFPVGVELGRGRVEEQEPGTVGRLGGAGEDRGEQRRAELVGGQQVQPGVTHVGRGGGHRVEDAPHAGANPLLGGAPGRPRRGGGSAATSEVEQMGALRLVELQGAGDALEDALGRAGCPAALQPDVVVDADSGQERDLFPAQPGHAAVAAVGGQPGLLRGDPRAPGDQEIADLVPVVHSPRLRSFRLARGVLSVPGTAGSPARRIPLVTWGTGKTSW
jgi:pimeloyl-ACP methyl ester carboxylesterase